MKATHILFFSIVLLTACTCNNDEQKPVSVDTSIVIPDTLLVYEVNPEARTYSRFTEVPDSAFTPARVVNGLNQKYPEVQLQLIGKSNDTIYVVVPNNEVLGERMGNAGASAWFQDVVLNLTGINGVTYVNITMERRSHASPGVFRKENVQGFQEVKDSIPAS